MPADGTSSRRVPPGALSALLEELAASPMAETWERGLRPGMVVGRFELVRELGHGGFGVVYEARDRELGRTVAFKAVTAGPRAALREERLLREAEAAARLSHPNIVTLHDVGRSEFGPYLILELLRGQTLAQRLEFGSLSAREALRTAVQVARGLAHAHAHAVVHRDLTPANVFLCDDGQVKVLDLGLAQAFGRRKLDGGTDAYMAPEQRRGAPEDERTDVFALGVIVHRMLAGALPLLGDRRRSGREEEPPPLDVRGVPALGPFLARMMAADPVRRPRDGGEVARALEAFELELGRVAAEDVSVVVTAHPRRGAAALAPDDEERRVAAVRSYEILDTPPESSYDQLTQLAARICKTPVAYIKFFDEKRAWFKSKVGFPPEFTEVPREATMCNTTVCGRELIVIPDCAVDERFRDNPNVTGWPHVRFYCSMPLIDPDGYALGTFCVFDYVPRAVSRDEQETIRILAHEAMTHLQLRRVSRRLSRSQGELERVSNEAEQERARADALLCHLVPREIAEELKATGHVEARHHPMVTVLFADFQGFSRLASGADPERLVHTLHEHFSAFDSIVERHGLEKIRTIADCYVCAGGVPMESRSHVVDTCLAALEMQGYMADVNRERARIGLDAWELRIGIHAGPVITGVVGRQKFTYDLWGEVVKVAQRMEVAGVPRRIVISDSVHERVRHLFEVEPRGPIELGGGRIATYLLHRIKPELAADPDGRLPNVRFAIERLRV